MDLSQRDGGLPPDSVVQDADTILADSERLIDQLHDPAPHAMLQIALAPCSPFSVTTRLMRDTAALAERHGVRLHTHLAETADEAAFCQARFGCSPLDYLEQCGWLRPGTWLAHGIHFARRRSSGWGGPGRGHALPVQQPAARVRHLPGLRAGGGGRGGRAGRGRLGLQRWRPT